MPSHGLLLQSTSETSDCRNILKVRGRVGEKEGGSRVAGGWARRGLFLSRLVWFCSAAAEPPATCSFRRLPFRERRISAWHDEQCDQEGRRQPEGVVLALRTIMGEYCNQGKRVFAARHSLLIGTNKVDYDSPVSRPSAFFISLLHFHARTEHSLSFNLHVL
jgi:hypothetical protein